MLYTQPESEWDDENRDWAIALQAADDNKCPSCGGPMNECLDPDARWEVGPPIRCQRSTQVAISQKKYFGDIPDGVDVQPRALIWGAKPKA